MSSIKKGWSTGTAWVSGALLSLVLTVFALPAQANWQDFNAVANILADADQVNEQGLMLEMPLVSEDGSAVPITVKLDHPMTEDRYITSIRILAQGNPNDEVVDFYLSPSVGRAEVSSRIRVNESQRIWAVATNNQGEAWVTYHDIRVTVGGCLMTADDNSSIALSQPRIALPDRFSAGQPSEIRTLVTHPMETGLREGPEGDILPRRLVERLVVTLGDETALEVHLHTAVSANPYLRFFLAPQSASEANFVWHEDTGFKVEEQVSLTL